MTDKSHTFVNNLGSRPVDHYHYDQNGNIIGTHYKRYQWYLDGAPVGGDQGSYNVSDQVKGTSHTIAATWGWTAIMPELEGALVEVIQYEEIVESGTSDANGEIEFTLPIGTYFVRVSKNGYITHTYMMECLVAKECRVLNLPIEPLWIQGLQFIEAMTETPAVSKTPGVVETMALTPRVSLFTEDPVFSLSMSAAAAKNPTTWRLQVVEPVSSDGG